MNHTEANHTENRTPAPVRRSGPDLLTLVTGLAALAIAGIALFGDIGRLPGVDVRWVLAAGAILVGLVLVVGSIRPRRR